MGHSINTRSFFDKFDAFQYLISQGANCLIKAKDGEDIISLAKKKNKNEYVNYIYQQQRERINFQLKNPPRTYEIYQIKTNIGMDYSWVTNPVGQVVKIDQFNNVQSRYCTGFNIGKGYFLTAGHCVAPESICLRMNDEETRATVRIDFNYQISFAEQIDYSKQLYPMLASITSIADQGTCHIKVDGTEIAIDYAVYKLEDRAQQFGNLTLAKDISSLSLDTELLISHHPDGTTKKVSHGYLQGTDINKGQIDYTMFTLGGSSGSPIVGKATHLVNAVHVAGSVDNIGAPDQKHHYGIMSQNIIQTAHNNNQPWVKDLNLEPPSNKQTFNNS